MVMGYVLARQPPVLAKIRYLIFCSVDNPIGCRAPRSFHLLLQSLFAFPFPRCASNVFAFAGSMRS